MTRVITSHPVRRALSGMRSICYGAGMRGLLPMLRIILLSVLLWSGNVAHAAEDIECLTPPGAEAVHADEAEHAPSPSDQTPGDSGKANHQHMSCHGHHVASASSDASGLTYDASSQLRFGLAEPFLIGTAPDAALRPPIA